MMRRVMRFPARNFAQDAVQSRHIILYISTAPGLCAMTPASQTHARANVGRVSSGFSCQASGALERKPSIACIRARLKCTDGKSCRAPLEGLCHRFRMQFPCPIGFPSLWFIFHLPVCALGRADYSTQRFYHIQNAPSNLLRVEPNGVHVFCNRILNNRKGKANIDSAA